MPYISLSLAIPKPLIVQATDRILHSQFRSAARPLASWRTEVQCVLNSLHLRMGYLTSQLIADVSHYTLSYEAIVDIIQPPHRLGPDAI